MGKSIILSAICLIMGLNLSAQTSEMLTPSNEWSLIYQKDGIDFYVKNEDCFFPNNKEPLVYSFMKMVNTTSKSVKVNCNFGLVFMEACVDCENAESAFETKIPANSALEASCENKISSLSRLVVNKNLKGGYEFRGVQLFNIKLIK
jgi:hypothetical protein